MTTKAKTYAVHNLLNIKTNLLGIIPDYFMTNSMYSNDNDYDIELYCASSRDIDRLIGNLNIESHSGFLTGSKIGFSQTAMYAELGTPFLSMLGMKRGFRVIIEKKQNNGYKVYIELDRWLKLRPVLYRIGVYIEKIISTLLLILLLRKNYLFTHSAAVSYNGEGILIHAFSNTGKTPTCQFLVRSGMEFMSDDHSIIGKNRDLYAYPEPSGRTSELWEKIQILNYFLNPRGHMYKFKVSQTAKLRYIFVLLRGSDMIKELRFDEALRKLTALNNEEIHSFLCSPISYLINYGSFSGIFPQLQDIYNAYETILRSTISDHNISIYEIKTNNTEKFGISILQIVRKAIP